MLDLIGMISRPTRLLFFTHTLRHGSGSFASLVVARGVASPMSDLWIALTIALRRHIMLYIPSTWIFSRQHLHRSGDIFLLSRARDRNTNHLPDFQSFTQWFDIFPSTSQPLLQLIDGKNRTSNGPSRFLCPCLYTFFTCAEDGHPVAPAGLAGHDQRVPGNNAAHRGVGGRRGER
ncbi:hypothetical protein BDW75DRAFT_104873 [Aspergillus navahoensis]